MKKMFVILMALVVLTAAVAQAGTDAEAKIKELQKRIQKLEVKSATDRVKFTGEYRFEAHNISSTLPDHYDGMALQNVMVNTMFFHQTTGGLPMNEMGEFLYGDVQNHIMSNSGDYMAWTQGLSYDGVGGMMGEMLFDMGQAGFIGQQVAGGMSYDDALVAWNGFTQSPDFAAFLGTVQEGAMGMMMAQDGVYREGYDWDNKIMYTSRLRLNMSAKVNDDVSFSGRLGMYKPWGDSSGVQVFNGQSNTMNIDGNSTSVPNSDILRVDRAYFNWKNFLNTPAYLSIGRRPSAGGPPLHLRQDEMRAGTPLGTIIDFQFDGITVGYNEFLWEESTLRACYGVGYESGFGSGEQLKSAADRMKDCSFFGFNWDLYSNEESFVQATVARAFDVTDGFNGVVVMPNDPLSGNAMPGPMVIRYTPSANLGDIDLASFLVMRKTENLDLFASYSLMKSHPEEGVGTPFGGLFCNPYEVAEEQDGNMLYLGARMHMPNGKTKVGIEYNKGSQYWFNFASAADDIIAPKTSTRGSVIEAYVTHRIGKGFIGKLDYMKYNYDYSGSGWHLGAPQDMDGTPILGFPTYDEASKLSISLIARF